MTTEREKAIEKAARAIASAGNLTAQHRDALIAALSLPVEAPKVAEPVAEVLHYDGDKGSTTHWFVPRYTLEHGTKLYAAPPAQSEPSLERAARAVCEYWADNPIGEGGKIDWLVDELNKALAPVAAQGEAVADSCPYAAPFKYCQYCAVDHCPIGLGDYRENESKMKNEALQRARKQPLEVPVAAQGEATLINGGAWHINEAAWLKMTASEQTKFLHQISFYEGWKSGTKLPSGFSTVAAQPSEQEQSAQVGRCEKCQAELENEANSMRTYPSHPEKQKFHRWFETECSEVPLYGLEYNFAWKAWQKALGIPFPEYGGNPTQPAPADSGAREAFEKALDTVISFAHSNGRDRGWASGYARAMNQDAPPDTVHDGSLNEVRAEVLRLYDARPSAPDLEALRRDAVRYRWLRKSPTQSGHAIEIFKTEYRWVNGLHGDALDTAIDAAREKS